MTPTLEADLKAFLSKGKPQINVHGQLNLNNLDTSLTKEFDRTILSNVNSAKNKPTALSLSAKKEKSDPVGAIGKKDKLDISPYRDKAAAAKRPFFSPIPKNDRPDSNLIHQRHTSNPDAVEPYFPKDIYGDKARKESEPAVYYPTDFTPRQVGAAVNSAASKKTGALPSERYHTEGCQNVITEAEVIYEAPSSRRRTPDKSKRY